jgi:hypothetical protein
MRIYWLALALVLLLNSGEAALAGPAWTDELPNEPPRIPGAEERIVEYDENFADLQQYLNDIVPHRMPGSTVSFTISDRWGRVMRASSRVEIGEGNSDTIVLVCWKSTYDGVSFYIYHDDSTPSSHN